MDLGVCGLGWAGQVPDRNRLGCRAKLIPGRFRSSALSSTPTLLFDRLSGPVPLPTRLISRFEFEMTAIRTSLSILVLNVSANFLLITGVRLAAMHFWPGVWGSPSNTSPDSRLIKFLYCQIVQTLRLVLSCHVRLAPTYTFVVWS